jgi:hypothetical protein
MESRSQLRHRPTRLGIRPENITAEYQDGSSSRKAEYYSIFCQKHIDCSQAGAHNQTTGKPARRGFGAVSRSGRMNTIFDPVSSCGQDALLGRLDLTPPQNTDFKATAMEELVHALRQPLGVIESIAYFLEITSEDERLWGHMQRIQAMVLQANHILEQHCEPRRNRN